MNINEFVTKWSKSELKERAGSQEHFLDLCEVFEHPKPALADPLGEEFTFEKGAAKHGGGQGFADVWKRRFFSWEYKGKHKDLDAAYDQLLKYREALENTPLLVVCDMDRFVIHTNFTATPSKTYEIGLDDLTEPRNIEILRSVFYDPEKLRPDRTSEAITQEVARRVGEVAQGLRKRSVEGTQVARFLDRVVFCLFAEDVGLLPKKLFSRLVDGSRDPEHFAKRVGDLFNAMAEGGDFGIETILHFNGNLFTASPVLELTHHEIRNIQSAAKLDNERPTWLDLAHKRLEMPCSPLTAWTLRSLTKKSSRACWRSTTNDLRRRKHARCNSSPNWRNAKNSLRIPHLAVRRNAGSRCLS